jgi:N-acetylmuramoyl-L-alanine amidase
MAIQEVWLPSPNYSASRGPYNKAVFHTTEGAMKIRDLGAWFAQPAAQCSSHHGADNYERGVFGAYVYENYKAWTQGNANPYCLSIELCAYASWSRDTWLYSKGVLVDNAAEWLAYITGKYGIPWTVLSNAQAQDPNARGICQHSNLGSWGSGHSDCGSGFPLDVVVSKAMNQGKAPVPPAGGTLMSSGVAFYQGKQYVAYVNPSGQVCVNGGVVDPNSNAKSGVGLAIDPDCGRKVITYTNQGGDLCKYIQEPGSSDWGWTDTGLNAQ